ncbi:HTH_Tnp_Tc3_2 domain-containing protein [Trichonephila clavipes]|nr:HTH_Tnp_Tc3_2 domain-containing protein [Trichonephila clavipes]
MIGLEVAGWANRRIALRVCRRDAAIRRCWQEWVDDSIFQHHDGSCHPRAAVNREDRLIVRSSVREPDSSLSDV